MESYGLFSTFQGTSQDQIEKYRVAKKYRYIPQELK